MIYKIPVTSHAPFIICLTSFTQAEAHCPLFQYADQNLDTGTGLLNVPKRMKTQVGF